MVCFRLAQLNIILVQIPYFLSPLNGMQCGHVT